MKFDDITVELGEFGPYQKKLYFLLCLVSIPAALNMLVGVFTLDVPAHRCAIPNLNNDTYKSQGAWHDQLVNLSVPWSPEDNDYSKCYLYQGAGSSNLDQNHTVPCSKWVYKKDPFQSTFITQASLVCQDQSLRTYANMILMGGLMAGSLVMGFLSDLIGRRKVLLVGLAGKFVSSLSTAFVTTYVPFVILRFFTTFFGVGVFLPAFVIGMELVGPRQRKIAGIVIEMFWCLGLFIETALAYWLREWNHLQIAISLPSAFLFFLFLFFIPESPRWLISNGRYEEAGKIIQQAAARNGVTLSNKLLRLEDIELEGKKEKIWQMFTTPALLIRCLVIFFNWFVSSMVYYGLGLNVGTLSGDIYLNFFLAAVVELLSYCACLALLDRLGRKPLQCISMLIGGIACICTLFPVIFGEAYVAWLTLVFSLIGKFGISAGFAIIYVFSAEIFPTVMRNSGMGLSSFSARMGGILSPYIADIGNTVRGDVGIAIPLLIFGSLSVAAGVLALILPETVNRNLPDTVEDAKDFIRNSHTPGKRSYHVQDKHEEDPSLNSGTIHLSFSMENKF